MLAAREELELKVFFLSDFSLHAHRETAFGQTVKWDVNLTDGYDWEVLPRWGIGRSTSMRPWWPVRGLKGRLKKGRFDAVWVHGWGHVGLRQATHAANALGLPLLLRGESTPDGSRATGIKRWWRDYYCRRLVSQTAACLCIGSQNRKFYRQFGASDAKLFHVPYAVDNAWFQARCAEASLRRDRLRELLGLEPGRPVILFAAKFIPVKAPGDLLEAYQKAWGQNQKSEIGNPNRKAETLKSEMQKRGSLDQPLEVRSQKSEDKSKPYLLFVGDGSLRSDLENQAGESGGNDVRFLGFRNQSELPAFYDLCDVFVLPSHFEPWGLVVNEVMNAGRPVIVSDRAGCAPDLVADGVNGLVYPHGDIPALAARLRQLFELPAGQRQGMGQKSLERINTWNFDADVVGLLQALKSVVKAGHD